ncbi:MAG: NtaA/DmoA family FMN-dependent monooxygenase [Lautropia sp.]|nr:NtaA/DmoA family FMN-dependent monooxygenase [Lautropia sp.]
MSLSPGTQRASLHIGMSLAPTWLAGDAWRGPDSGVEGIFSQAFFLDIARRAEAALADFVFCPDVMALRTDHLSQGAGFASLDPTMLLSALAPQTRHIGLLTTVSTLFFPPYVAARQIQSLNWLSKGRAGWNIVTALEGHGNFGMDSMPSAAERYARAEEFVSVVQQLWQSFPHEALRLDRDSGLFADPAQVRAIDHHGQYLSVQGPLNLPAFGEGRIPFVQAGASPEGRHFAAGVADAVFASTPDREAARRLRHDLRKLAEHQGRQPDAVKLMPGLSLYLAETGSAARQLHADTHGRRDPTRDRKTLHDLLGIDVSDWPLERVVQPDDLPAEGDFVPRSRTHAALLRDLVTREALPLGELLRRPEVMGSAHWQVVGTVDDAIGQIEDWFAHEAIDGFVALPGGSVSSMHRVLDALLPRLSQAGLFRKQYSSSTFIGHLLD